MDLMTLCWLGGPLGVVMCVMTYIHFCSGGVYKIGDAQSTIARTTWVSAVHNGEPQQCIFSIRTVIILQDHHPQGLM